MENVKNEQLGLTIDIGSGESELNERLSNFTTRQFIFEGVTCYSMEGFLQSLKFEDPEKQKQVCLLSGIKAKRKGQRRNKHWIPTQTLYWKGNPLQRDSSEYLFTIERAYLSLFLQSPEFRNDLEATGNSQLIHSIGKSKELGQKYQTVLTEQEFCNILTRLREILNKRF